MMQKAGENINIQSASQKLKSSIKHPVSFVLFVLIAISVIFTVVSLGFLIGYILINGIPNLTPKLFAWHYTTENASMLPALINTIWMTILALAIAIPFGIGAAIYMVEYAKKGNKIVEIVRITAETLTGMLFFVTTCKMGLSLLAGALTLAIMVLPVIMRTTEEALLAVPDSFREGSFGLGAGKLRTVFRIVLPPAIPGISSGIILAMGRIVGETAALIYTAGTVAEMPKNIFSSTRTLAVHMYSLSSEGLYMDQAYATAVVLLVIVMLINLGSTFVAKKINKY